ncbi:MAG: hypothetical protein ACK2T6_08065 [Anaerolineae bacterium]
MTDSPNEVRRAEALRDIIRAQRQVANALDALRSSDEDERGAAMIALEHAHVKLGGALADFYSAADEPGETTGEDAEEPSDELHLRRLHAAVEALEERAARESGAIKPGGGAADAGTTGRVERSQPTGAAAGASAEELANLIARVAHEVAEVRSVVAESSARSLDRRLASSRLSALEDRLSAVEQRLRIVEHHLIESGGPPG